MFFKKKVFVFSCDECGRLEEFSGLSNFREVRLFGWAISKTYKKCYCPNCAPEKRNVGRPARPFWQ